MKLLFLLIFFSMSATSSFSQVNDKDECATVLRMKQVGKEFSFNKSKAGSHDSLVLVYLGEIKTKNGDELKIMTSRWYWGLSPRATTRMMVFNAKNKRLGNYYLSMTYDVPKKIEESSVVFINDKGKDCTPGLITKVDFADGIPKEFFLRCDSVNGDAYQFSPGL